MFQFAFFPAHAAAVPSRTIAASVWDVELEDHTSCSVNVLTQRTCSSDAHSNQRVQVFFRQSDLRDWFQPNLVLAIEKSEKKKSRSSLRMHQLGFNKGHNSA